MASRLLLLVFVCGFLVLAEGKRKRQKPAPLPTETFEGDATYTMMGMGACGKVNNDKELVAAINREQYGNTANPNNGPWCGRCVEVTSDKFGTSVVVKIVDRAEGSEGHIVLSPAAFEVLASKDFGRIDVSYKLVDCN